MKNNIYSFGLAQRGQDILFFNHLLEQKIYLFFLSIYLNYLRSLAFYLLHTSFLTPLYDSSRPKVRSSFAHIYRYQQFTRPKNIEHHYLLETPLKLNSNEGFLPKVSNFLYSDDVLNETNEKIHFIKPYSNLTHFLYIADIYKLAQEETDYNKISHEINFGAIRVPANLYLEDTNVELIQKMGFMKCFEPVPLNPHHFNTKLIYEWAARENSFISYMTKILHNHSLVQQDIEELESSKPNIGKLPLLTDFFKQSPSNITQIISKQNYSVKDFILSVINNCLSYNSLNEVTSLSLENIKKDIVNIYFSNQMSLKDIALMDFFKTQVANKLSKNESVDIMKMFMPLEIIVKAIDNKIELLIKQTILPLIAGSKILELKLEHTLPLIYYYKYSEKALNETHQSSYSEILNYDSDKFTETTYEYQGILASLKGYYCNSQPDLNKVPGEIKPYTE